MTKDNTLAAAAYNENSTEELAQALNDGPDRGDMREWNLTAEQWRHEIMMALQENQDDE